MPFLVSLFLVKIRLIRMKFINKAFARVYSYETSFSPFMLIVIHKFLNRIFKATLLLATIGLACHQLGLFIRSYCAKGSPTSDESSPCRGLTGGAKRGEAWRSVAKVSNRRTEGKDEL